MPQKKNSLDAPEHLMMFRFPKSMLEMKKTTILYTLILQRGVDVNTAESDGTTGLMAAAFAGHPHVVETLLQCGAEINRVNFFFFTPLQYLNLFCYVCFIKASIYSK